MAANNSWRRRVFFAMLSTTLLVAAMTLPSLAAPNKTMTFQVNSTGPTTADFDGAVNTALAGTPNVSFWIRATNTTPGTGNPTSLRVTAPTSPSPGFVITSAQINNGNSSRMGNNTPPVIGGSGAFVDFNNIQPLQNHQYITVKIVATTPPAACPTSVQSNDWTGVLWQGSTVGNALPFSTTVQSGTVTTLSPTSCSTLEFVTAPHNAATNTQITGTDFDPDGANVQVALEVGGSTSTSFDGATVTITEDGTGSISGDTAVLSAGLAEFPGLQIDTAGDYNLTATVTGGPSTSPPVAITITPAGVCPGGVSGQEDFTTTEFVGESGVGTLNIGGLTSGECAGLIVTFSVDPVDGAQQWFIDVHKLSIEDKITGYATWTWDLPGTGPVPWTQIKWKHSNGVSLEETNFIDLPRCNADAVTDPMPDPTLPNPAYSALFPTVSTSLGNIPAGVCMFNSTLQAVGGTYTEAQQVALNEDAGARKS